MENLRRVIEAMFLRRDVFDAYAIADNKIEYDKYSQQECECLVDTLRSIDSNITVDQVRAVAQLAFDEWRSTGNDFSLQYSVEDSWFNVLLHFTSRVLALKDGVPICQYAHLLRWNDLSSMLGEDLLVVSYLASKDLVTCQVRADFAWDEHIGHNNRAIASILRKNLPELHAHLNGSTSVFYLNWLSLMNCIGKLQGRFTKLKRTLSNQPRLFNEDAGQSLRLNVVKAAAIRYFLSVFLYDKINDEEIYLLKRIVSSLDVEDILPEVMSLQSRISAYSAMVGYRFLHRYSPGNVVDYNIRSTEMVYLGKEARNYFLTVFSGERAFMYRAFQYIFRSSHQISGLPVEELFYQYLLIKAKFRQELIQLNDTAGFANFSNYQDRKSFFILKSSIYDHLIPLMAVASSVYERPKERYLETRISPTADACLLNKKIAQLDRHIRDDQFSSHSSEWRYHYILHFIKRKDSSKSNDENHCRNYDLRRSVRNQAFSIFDLRYYKMSQRARVIGVDAASSELDAKPEVFAQAYRFLRMHPFVSDDIDHPSDLGMTYHVGEDYFDVVDGLRAIDEVIHFMNFTDGDRLGHAFVLGENVRKYYMFRNNRVVMPMQELLDNVVWLHHQATLLSIPHLAEMSELYRIFEQLFSQIYSNVLENNLTRPESVSGPSIHQYYQSWLLRGDDPLFYSENSFKPIQDGSRWNQFGLNMDREVSEIRGDDSLVSKLYALYHYNPMVKSKGRKMTEWHIAPSMINLIDEVREMMLCKVEKKHLCIECNPTSNFKIGALPRYAVHPIVKFFNYGLDTTDDMPKHALTVSINTDDKGVFSTSLEREYSLMALALEKQEEYGCYNNPRQIYDWLDRVRQLGLESRFDFDED